MPDFFRLLDLPRLFGEIYVRMNFILSALGRIFALTPDFILRGLCLFSAEFICVFMPRRKRVLYSNIKKCFPHIPFKKVKAIAKESSARTVEMALFVLASPYLSDSELRKRFKLSDMVVQNLKKYAENPKPLVLLVPHFCMMEAITMLPVLHSGKTPKTGVFYRPFNSAGLEKWIKKSRSRFGINLISRRNGFGKAFEILGENGCMAVLFDQNPLTAGYLTWFFDMVCYTSHLAGMLVKKSNADCAVFYAHRTGFMQATIDGEFLNTTEVEDVVKQSNLWLESHMKADLSTAEDWLWLHNRWKCKRNVGECLNLKHSKDLLDYTLPEKFGGVYPRKLKYFVTMPDSASDATALLPLVEKMYNSRRDADIVLLCRKNVYYALKDAKIKFDLIKMPEKRGGIVRYYKGLFALRDTFPDVHFVFDTSGKSDFETWVIGAFVTVGISKTAKNKKLKCPFVLSESDRDLPLYGKIEKMLLFCGLKE